MIFHIVTGKLATFWKMFPCNFLHFVSRKVFNVSIEISAGRGTDNMDKRLFALLGLGLILLFFMFFLQPSGVDVQVDIGTAKGADPQINWIWNDLNKGIQVAKEMDKPVLINFWADWCIWCVKMDKEVMSDVEVIDFVSENFVPVKIDSDLPENRGLLMFYRITGHPSFVILDKNGRFRAKAVGYMPKDIFLQFLEAYGTES